MEKYLVSKINELFKNGVLIDTNTLVFDEKFRYFCHENKCNKYNENYSCPPLCGTFSCMKNKILKYQKALVLIDLYKANNIEKSTKIHNEKTRKIKKIFQENNIDALMAGACNCDICEKCMLKSNKPCIDELNAFSSVSAYCIDVKKLLDDIGISMIYNDKLLSLISILFFNIDSVKFFWVKYKV